MKKEEIIKRSKNTRYIKYIQQAKFDGCKNIKKLL